MEKKNFQYSKEKLIQQKENTFKMFLQKKKMDYRTEDPPTFIHFSGSGSHPDLLLASSDISHNIKRNIIEDPGSGHRAIIASIKIDNIQKNEQNRKLYWNFKKGDWNKYRTSLDSKLQEHN